MDEDELNPHVFNSLPEEYKKQRLSCYLSIAKMNFKDSKKEICWFWKTDLNGRNKKEKEKPEDKVLALIAR